MSIKVKQSMTKQSQLQSPENMNQAEKMLAERKQSKRTRSPRAQSPRAMASRRRASRQLVAGLKRELAGEQGRQTQRALAELASTEGFARRLEAAQRELEKADSRHGFSVASEAQARMARVRSEADLRKRLLEARDAVKISLGRREGSVMFGVGRWPQGPTEIWQLGQRLQAVLLEHNPRLARALPGIELDAGALAASLEGPLGALEAAFESLVEARGQAVSTLLDRKLQQQLVDELLGFGELFKRLLHALAQLSPPEPSPDERSPGEPSSDEPPPDEPPPAALSCPQVLREDPPSTPASAASLASSTRSLSAEPPGPRAPAGSRAPAASRKRSGRSSLRRSGSRRPARKAT